MYLFLRDMHKFRDLKVLNYNKVSESPIIILFINFLNMIYQIILIFIIFIMYILISKV